MSMSLNKKHAFVSALLLVTALVALVPRTAEAQVNVDVDITMEGVVILHYFSALDVTLTSAVLESWLAATAAQGSDSANAADNTGLESDHDIANNGSDMTVDPTAASVNLALLRVWAVRSINTNGSDTRVAVNTPGGAAVDLDNTAAGSTAKITVNTVAVKEGAQAWANQVDFTPAGLFTLTVGDVRLTMDMTNATESGDYAAGGGVVYQLTATNL